MEKVKVIGAGLAGTEAANYLANRGIEVDLYDIKPKKLTPAHNSTGFAELVCSNSLKSGDIYGNAAGLLKEEIRRLGSIVMESAEITKVPAGNALAVNREEFSNYITRKIRANKNISVVSEEADEIDFDEYTVIATGPLTTPALAENIAGFTGGALSFFDASAPIVTKESIDFGRAFI
ncbi:MAG: FAD-dependent oxidoreductase, partial [Clostridia bacterium]|nr:FAD-dependent oxidoreductase [Clostridia bacterium]